eukprot:361174-Chlamydomonas_euryale.AAC.4
MEWHVSECCNFSFNCIMAVSSVEYAWAACAITLVATWWWHRLSYFATPQMMKVEVTKFNKRYGIVKMQGKGYVGQDLVVEAEMTLAMGNA